MSRTAAALLGSVGAVLGWMTSAWPLPVPWVALAVAYATVVRGPSTGVAAAVVGGVLLGAPNGTSGLWVVAFGVAVATVDRLHRETLTHRTPAAPVLLAVVAVAVSLLTYWMGTFVVHLLRGSVVGPTVEAVPVALGLSVVATAAAVFLGRSLRSLGRTILHRVR